MKDGVVGSDHRLMNRPRRHDRSSRLLQLLVFAMALAPIPGLFLQESLMPFSIRLLGCVLWGASLAPAIGYLRDRAGQRPPIPFLAVIGLLFGLYYALPAALGTFGIHWVITLDPRFDYNLPTVLALEAWCMLLVGYHLLRARWRRPSSSFTPQLEPARLKYWGLAMIYLGIALDVLRQAALVPLAIRGILQFGVTITWFATALLIVLLVRKQLRRTEKTLLLIAVAGNIVLQLGTGSVATLAIYLTVIILAAWVELGSLRARWILAAVAGALTVCAMRGVAAEFRSVAWFGGQRLTAADRASLMTDLLRDRLRTDGLFKVVSDGVRTVAVRSANLDLFADVVRRTPDEIPYWSGETYKSLLGMAVPRFLWPDKPTKALGQAFGHRYGYLAAQNTSTSVNLPYMVEFYANFGTVGLLIGMLGVGMVYATLERYTNRPSQPIAASVVGIALLTPLLNMESDFSLTFGGLFLNALALRAFLVLMRTRTHTGDQNAAHAHVRTLAPSQISSALPRRT